MKILFVTISYPPFKVGGTEVYVQGLADALSRKNVSCAVSFPCLELSELNKYSEKCDFKQVEVFPVIDPASGDKILSGFSIFGSFKNLLENWKPDIVHFHPLTLPTFIPWLQEVPNLPVIFTFHSSTTTCLRGDLLWHGKVDCSGAIDRKKCVECFQHSKGVPIFLSGLPTLLPDTFLKLGSRLLRNLPFTGKSATYLETPLQIEQLRDAWNYFINRSSRVVAVCNWVRDAFLVNGVSPEKVVLSRHGLRDELVSKKYPVSTGKAVFGFIGRLWPEKGIEILVNALKGIDRNLDFEFQFCSSTFRQVCNQDFLVKLVKDIVKVDARIKILGHIPDNEMATIMGSWDALLVPSLWFESGPQVVYESFNVGTPVIGSNRGGIAELVEHEKTGFLVPPGDAIALRETLVRVIKNPELIRKMRSNISAVRTMSDVADDMINIYNDILMESRLQS